MRELLYIFISGMEYGIWNDELLSVKDNLSIHHLPLVHSCIAGISLVNDRIITLADISACIGHPPVSRFSESHILLLSEQQEIAGFASEGEIGKSSISPDEIHSIPNYLQTPLIDTCVLHDRKPIPVINISTLYDLVLQDDYEPVEYKLHQSNIKQNDVSSIKSFRLIEVSGNIFAFPQTGYEEESPVPQEISSVALIPKFVKGIVFYNGNVFPLISLSKRMKLNEEGSAELMLVADIEEKRFGFLIDSDRGISNIDIGTLDLPPLVQSSWMRDSIVNNGEIIPIIDPCALISASTDDEDEIPLPQRYSPNLKFESMPGNEEVEVVEFSLLGVRYALPGMEVVDYLPFKQLQKIPNVQPIVLGIVEHEGELLPVLDLALCFGRHSPATSQWQMILLENGDFRALVITDKVYGNERIPVSLHRKLPIKLPHKVIYGCYLDMENNAVRLMLNVEAMSVYFEETSVVEFFHSVSKTIECTMGFTLEFSNDKAQSELEISQDIDAAYEQPKDINTSNYTEAAATSGEETGIEAGISNDAIKLNEVIQIQNIFAYDNSFAYYEDIEEEETSSDDTTTIEGDAGDEEFAQMDEGAQITEERQHAEDTSSGETIAIEGNAKKKNKKIIYASLASLTALIAIIIYFAKNMYIQKNIDKTEIIETARPTPIKKTTTPEVKKPVLTYRERPVSSKKAIRTPQKPASPPITLNLKICRIT